MSLRLNVLIVDDHSILRAALVAAIRMSDRFLLAGEASTAAQAFELCRAARPEVVVLDSHLPDMSGAEATTRLRQEFPEIKIIITARYDATGEIPAAVKAGARGFILKDRLDTELLRALQAVAAGQFYFPPEFNFPTASGSDSVAARS